MEVCPIAPAPFTSRALLLSIWTVKAHVSRIIAKLGAWDRAQIVIAVYEADGPTCAEPR